jgi:hypothetical protein
MDTYNADKIAQSRRLMQDGKVEEWVATCAPWIVRAYYRDRFETQLFIPRPWAHLRDRYYWAFANEYFFLQG